MPSVSMFDMQGKDLGTVDLKEEIFGLKSNEALVHQAVVRHLANRRSGTADTKGRGEIRGGGKKPWRQKGTGRARHGSTRSPIWRKGGVVWGPTPRSYVQAMPKKMRKLAIKVVLSDKVRNNALLAVDQLQMEEIKTKKFVEVVHNLKLVDRSLFVLAAPDATVQRSANNLPYAKVVTWSDLNVYELLKHGRVILTRDAIAAIEEAYNEQRNH